MKVTIVKADNSVVIDGEGRKTDCAAISPMISAIQWDTEKKEGWIEFVQSSDSVMPNVKIIDLKPFQSVVQDWGTQRVKEYDDMLHRLQPIQQQTALAAATLAKFQVDAPDNKEQIAAAENDWARKRTAEDDFVRRLTVAKSAAEAARAKADEVLKS